MNVGTTMGGDVLGVLRDHGTYRLLHSSLHSSHRILRDPRSRSEKDNESPLRRRRKVSGLLTQLVCLKGVKTANSGLLCCGCRGCVTDGPLSLVKI